MSVNTKIIEACFSASKNVRYVAVYLDGNLTLKPRAEMQPLGSDESDRYEEIIVNPTLLKLVTQRGNIDCGGCKYVIVHYGNFFAFIYPLLNGHVTVSFELTTKLEQEVNMISAVIDQVVVREIQRRKHAKVSYQTQCKYPPHANVLGH
jgi:hypothetical protein